MGFDEYFYGRGVSVIEWADKIESFLPEERIVLDIENIDNTDKRKINITIFGDRYKEIVKELEKN